MEVGIFNKQNLAYKENVKNKEMGNMSTQLKSNPKVIITKDINGLGPSTYDIRFFRAIFDLPTYPYSILAWYKVYFRLVISDF